jgi:hypothetical protein
VLPLYHLEKVISWGILNPYVPVYCILPHDLS